MYSFSKKILMFSSIILSIIFTMSFAAIHPVPSTTISSISSYEAFGDGDVIFTVSNPPSGVSGFWLSPNDKGFKNVLASLLAARTNGLPIIINFDDSVLWTGSGSIFYKVYNIAF
jgi:hypothetical protein